MNPGKPRILRIINRFNVGGPTYNAAFLTKYLEVDFESMLIGGEKQESEASSLYITENLGLTIRVIPEMTRSIGIINDIKAYLKISKIIKEFRPDIVHTHASKAGAIGRIAARRNKVPFIVHTFHGHVFEHYFGKAKTSLIMAMERYLASFTDRIVAIGNAQKNDLGKRFKICSENKIVTIPLGFELEKFSESVDAKRSNFRKTYSLNENQVAVGIIGRLVPIKNHRLFIDVLSDLKMRDVPVKAFVIGDGELKEELIKYARSLNLSVGVDDSDIVFTSWIKNVDEAMAGLDIVALTSRNEGTPVSLIEAQATGKVVISTDVGGVKDVMSDGESGILCPDNDKSKFCESLEKLILDKNLRTQMGEKGKEFTKEKFHVNRLVSDIKKLYLELLNQ